MEKIVFFSLDEMSTSSENLSNRLVLGAREMLVLLIFVISADMREKPAFSV
jgi:hypothetical protein